MECSLADINVHGCKPIRAQATHALASVPLRRPSLAHLVHKPNFPHLPIPNAFPTFPSPCNSIPHLAPPAHNSEDYAPLLTTPHIHMRSLYILSLAPLVYRTCTRSPSVHTLLLPVGTSSGLGRVMGWDARPSTSARAHPGHRWRHHRPCGTRTDACDPCEAAESPPTTSRMPPAPPQKERMKTRRQQQGASFTLSLDVDGDGRAYRDAYRLNIWRRCTMSN